MANYVVCEVFFNAALKKFLIIEKFSNFSHPPKANNFKKTARDV